MNGILKRYIYIHDDIFKSSVRRTTPSQGIFDPIDFGYHYNNLGTLKEELKVITQNIQTEGKTSTIFKQYSEALLDTITSLYQICGKLYQKSQGDTSYSMDQYESNVALYESLVQKYQTLGVRLNDQINK